MLAYVGQAAIFAVGRLCPAGFSSEEHEPVAEVALLAAFNQR